MSNANPRDSERVPTSPQGIAARSLNSNKEGVMAVCERYAAGLLGRNQLIDKLVNFPYAVVERDPFDDFSPDPPGAWSEVEDAENLGLIDEGVYEELFARRHTFADVAPEGSWTRYGHGPTS